ncbi:MAG: lipoyl synthase [Deltaproteobacteria bacterium]|nr:MAG: lipoyl synthase [Deltaproteobacteria bacterium]
MAATVPRRLPVLDASEPDPRPRKRHPPWIRARFPGGEGYNGILKRVRELGLHTVCQSASCPNIGECWNHRALTIMILGDVCTRSCRFCDVATGRPAPPDPDEPENVARMLAELRLTHTVITSVDRDDLPDGGAAHWAATLEACHRAAPWMTIEVLTGDFKGNLADVDTVLEAGPDVFAHNLETVPRLSRQVRVQARYERSYAVLRHARERGALTKTGLMLGLGETLDEVREVICELADLGLSILTLGQYLQPSRKHLPVDRYVHPDEFADLAVFARSRGIAHVESGPLVRSSYHAEGQADLVRRLQRDGGVIGFASLRPPVAPPPYASSDTAAC